LGFVLILDLVVGAGEDGDIQLGGCAASGCFVSHQFHGFRTGTDESQASFAAGTGEGRVLGQESITWMYGVYLSLLGYSDDLVDAEIALCGRRRADMIDLVGIADVESRSVCIGIDAHRTQSELPARAQYPYGDLSSIGYQYLPEHMSSWVNLASVARQ
jgi:hypothetical protein